LFGCVEFNLKAGAHISAAMAQFNV